MGVVFPLVSRGASLKASAPQILEPALQTESPAAAGYADLPALLRGRSPCRLRAASSSHHPELREATAPAPSALSLAAACADGLPAAGGSLEGRPVNWTPGHPESQTLQPERR